ncbi:uncharacterized protein LOC115216737 [Argonauta hians]
MISFYPINRRTKRICLFFIVLIVFYSAYSMLEFPPPEFMKSDVDVRCELPTIDPYDKSIRAYIFQPKPLHCFSTPHLTFFNKGGLLDINKTVAQQSGFSLATINCSYQAVYRIHDDDHVGFQNPVSVTLPADIPVDFFLMTCQDADKHTFTHLHAHVSKKTFQKMAHPPHCPLSPYNVFIFGIDSLSRLNALRKLPLTYKYLTETLGGFAFKGYTKTGVNTFPNLIPLLTGKYTHQLKKTPVGSEYYDGYPVIWKNFSECQYVTMYSEDYPFISMFNYYDKGFQKQPTDHYMRPFWLTFENINPLKTFLDPVWLALENKQLRLGKSSKLCHGGSSKHMLVMNYLLSLFRRYGNKMPIFAFSWLNEISHDYLNMVEVGDKDFRDFFKVLNSEGFLDNTFLFFMSDHGHRFDWFRRTLIGRIEDKMPLLILKVPDKFKIKHPQVVRNLEENSEYLASPFDTHETIKDILYAKFEPHLNTSRNKHQAFQPISLFKQLPKSRTCSQAGIPQQFCACFKTLDINPNDKIVSILTEFMLKSINAFTENVRQLCTKFSFSSVLNVQKQVPSGSLLIKTKPKLFGFQLFYDDPIGIYIISMKVKPNDAIFEANINVRSTNSMEILGGIYRINRYGNQSFCVNEKKLKPYCYCI